MDDERDPILLELFQAETHDKDDAFTQAVIKRVGQQQKANVLMRTIVFTLLMVAVGIGLLNLATIPLFAGAPGAFNNLATPMGLLVLFGWIITRRANLV